MSEPLNPTALLALLAQCGVDFVVVGALAVGVHGEVRSTGDVDVMVPIDDEANKAALDKALRRLNARRIAVTEGGIEQGDAEYPTLMFQTSFGKLDVLYRPDGSAPYAKIKQRSVLRSLGGEAVRVVGKDDLVSMKLAAGREHDLQDVANLTAGEKGQPRSVHLTMKLAADADEDWAKGLSAERVSLFDARARVWVNDGELHIEARRSDLSEEQLHLWAQSLAERLHGSGVVALPQVELAISAL